MSAETALTMSHFGTATLGGVIDALKRAEPDAEVQFDFCYLTPTTVGSYRGYYDHLALGWKSPDAPPYWPKVSELLSHLEAAVGSTYEGWKGGDFRMDTRTPLWVANRGQTGSTGIVAIDVDEEPGFVIIRTAKVD